MILDQLDKITEKELKNLCEGKCPESSTLDFKSELPARDNKGKSEFLKDVCAFANSFGGDLVYGVKELSGCAESIVPIKDETIDEAKRRLGQMLDAGIEPRIQGIKYKEVLISEGYVLILWVPATYMGPHRYKLDGQSKFVARNDVYTFELSYEQLRLAFEKTSTLIEKAKNFRTERLENLIVGRTWKPLPRGPLQITHIIPVNSFANGFSLDITSLYKNDWVKFHLPNEWRSGGLDRSANLDGLACGPTPFNGREVKGYIQLFRSGSAEIINSFPSDHVPEQFKDILPPDVIASFCVNSVQNSLQRLREQGLKGAAVIGISMLHAGGKKLAFNQHFQSEALDRPHLIIPEIWIDDVEAVEDVPTLMRSSLDILWQSFGAAQCTLYDQDGKFLS